MQRVNYPQRLASPGAYQTYSGEVLRDDRYRPESCVGYQCDAYVSGWRTAVDESTDLGARQAHYIRTESRRAFVETRDRALTVFTFEAGQTCFASPHWIPQEVFTLHRGDWRRSELLRTFDRPDQWVDDFAEHQQRIADRIKRG